MTDPQLLTRRALVRRGVALAAAAASYGLLCDALAVGASSSSHALRHTLEFLVNSEGFQPRVRQIDQVIQLNLDQTVLTGDFRRDRSPRLIDGAVGQPDAVAKLSEQTAIELLLGELSADEALRTGELSIAGNSEALLKVLPLTAESAGATLAGALGLNVVMTPNAQAMELLRGASDDQAVVVQGGTP